MKTASALLLGLLMGLSGCSLHHQQQERAYAHYQDDAAAIREAQAAWLILSSPHRSREWPEARKKYNACIRKLASHLKEAKREGGMNEKKRQSLPFIIEKSPYAKDSNPWFYEAIFMSDEVDPTFRLRESVTVEGMGIPLAGLAPQGVSRPHANVLKDNGNVHTLTAILDFDRMVDGKPTLRTIPRLMNEHGTRNLVTQKTPEKQFSSVTRQLPFVPVLYPLIHKRIGLQPDALYYAGSDEG